MKVRDCSDTRASRVADGDRAVDGRGGPEHIDEFGFVLWGHHGEVRDVAQVGQVEDALMRAAVVTDDTAPVDGEEDG